MLVSTLVTYFCLLLPVWGVAADEIVLGTGLLTGAGGAVAVTSLLATSHRRTLWSGRFGLLACAVLWSTAQIGLWSTYSRSLPEGAYLTWASLGFSALLAALCLIGVTFTLNDWWRWLGVGASGVAFLISLLNIWDVMEFGENLYAMAVTLAVVVTHANLILLPPLGRRHRWLQKGTIAAAVATGLGIDLLLLAGGSAGEISGRLTAAASILSGVGTLAIIVLGLYFRPHRQAALAATSAEPSAVSEAIQLVCPRCGHKQTLTNVRGTA